MATTGIFPLIAQRRAELAAEQINAVHKSYIELMYRAQELAEAVVLVRIEGDCICGLDEASALAATLLKDLRA